MKNEKVTPEICAILSLPQPANYNNDARENWLMQSIDEESY